VKVTSQTLENRQVELTIEVEDERVQQALHQAARRIADRANIPGFRKGKAPYEVVVRALGQDAVFEEMIEELGQKVYGEAMEQSQLDPYGPGELKDLKRDPLVLKFTVPLRPAVDLGDYRALRVPFTPPDVPEEDVEQVLKGLQERNATLEPAGEGPVEWNQVAVISMEARFSPESERPIFNQQGISVLIAESTDFPYPGFIPNLIGMKVGEEKSFALPVPEDTEDEEMRGKDIYYKVKLEDLKLRHLPALDDALAQTIGEYETLDALRQGVRADLEHRAIHEAEHQYADECLSKLAEQAHVEFPTQMLEEELDRLVEQTERRLKSQKMNLDEFLNIKKQTRDDYRNELRPRADKNVRQGLALNHLVEYEQIGVDHEEVEAQIQNIAAMYGQGSEALHAELASDRGRQSIAFELLTSKGIERLMSICKGENPPLPAADEPAPETDVAPATPAPGGESNPSDKEIS
jgi:trigger factor